MLPVTYLNCAGRTMMNDNGGLVDSLSFVLLILLNNSFLLRKYFDREHRKAKFFYVCLLYFLRYCVNFVPRLFSPAPATGGVEKEESSYGIDIT